MIYKYLTEKYKKTGFPFFRKVEIENKFPDSTELQELLDFGQIVERRGVNGIIIELIINS